MAEPIIFRYRAFLSYSHDDARTAKRLHRALEAFRIDKELVGRETSYGPIPQTLRPIFRDREDFTAGHTLTDQTIAALDASAALIVLCSPISAKSQHVNEELRLFKSRHPDRPVIPMIADGSPGDPERECFAPALRLDVAADGNVTDRLATVLAADLRESGDGFPLAVAKVVARLLDLSTDDVFRRAQRARRRGARIRNGVIGALALLAVAAGGSAAYAWQQLKTNEAFLEAMLKRATDIVNTAVQQAEKYNVPRKATLELLTRAEGLFDDMARLGRPTAALQLQKARMLTEFARNHAILGESEGQLRNATEAVRLLTALSIDGSTDEVDGRLALAHEQVGYASRKRGNLSAALSAFQSALALRKRHAANDPVWRRGVSVSLNNVASIQAAQGKFEDALASYHEALSIAAQLARETPDNFARQAELSAAHQEMGNILGELGRSDEALDNYRAGLEVADRLATAAPDDRRWQKTLLYLYQRSGDALEDLKRFPEALAYQEKGLAIAARLVEADPTNMSSQYDLAISHERIGNLLEASKDLQGALAAYQRSLAIKTRLLNIDPDNVQHRYVVALGRGRVADVLKKQGDKGAALALYRDDLADTNRLLEIQPSNSRYLLLQKLMLERIQAMLESNGEADEALTHQRNALSIQERLAQLNPRNQKLQQELADAYDELGNVFVGRQNLSEALEAFRQCATLRERLAQLNSGNAKLDSDLAISYEKVADVLLAQGKLGEALQPLQLSLAIAERLQQSDPQNVKMRIDFATIYGKLGRLHGELGDKTSALRFFKAGRAMLTTMDKDQRDERATQYLEALEADIAALAD